jgi:putative aldouronate transport system substrate-binding protein
MKKNVLCLVLALVLCLGCFAGCGSSTEASETTATSTSAETQTASVSEPEETAAAEEETTESTPSAEEAPAEEGITLPLTTEGAEVTVWYAGSPNQMPYLEDGTYTNTVANKAICEATGVNINFTTVSNEGATDAFNLLIASNDLPDIIDSFTNFYTLGMDYAVNEEEIIYDLAPYLEEQVPNFYSILEANPDVKRDITTDTGVIGGIYTLTTGNAYSGQGLSIRSDLLDAVGAEIPETYDEFEQTVKAIYDETGVQGALIYKNFFGQYFAGGFGTYAKLTTSPDVNYPIYQIDGKVQFAPLTEEYREYIATMQQWYAEKVIYQDYYVYTNPGELESVITSGEASVVMGSGSELETRNADADYEWLPMADLVKQPGDIIHTGTAAYQEGDVSVGKVEVITTQCKDLDLILSLYNYMFSEEGSMIASYGVENETFTYEGEKPVLTDLILEDQNIGANQAVELYLTTISSLIDATRTASSVTDYQIDCYDVWTSNMDDAYELDTSVLALTTEEASAINKVVGDIVTYMEESNVKFITGALNTDSDYDAFVATLQEMGVQDIVDAYQAAYDRYLQR